MSTLTELLSCRSFERLSSGNTTFLAQVLSVTRVNMSINCCPLLAVTALGENPPSPTVIFTILAALLLLSLEVAADAEEFWQPTKFTAHAIPSANITPILLVFMVLYLWLQCPTGAHSHHLAANSSVRDLADLL